MSLYTVNPAIQPSSRIRIVFYDSSSLGKFDFPPFPGPTFDTERWAEVYYTYSCVAAGANVVTGRVALDEKISLETVCNPPVANDTLAQTSLQIRKICESGEQTEDTPTEQVCASAQRLLKEAQDIAPFCLDPTAVEASEGDLLIHWDTPTKSLVLICPKDNRAPSIYKETLEGIRPVTSELINNVSAESLSEALTWVLQPTR